jgi:hypothetical protein
MVFMQRGGVISGAEWAILALVKRARKAGGFWRRF